MAVTLTQIPSTNTLARNQNLLAFFLADIAGNIYRARGSRALLQITGNKLTNGDTLIFQYTDPATAQNIALTFTANNGTGDLDLPSGTGFLDTQYVEVLFQKIYGHPEIEPHFSQVQESGLGIFLLALEARDRTQDWANNFDVTGITAAIYTSSILAPIPTIAPENFAFVMEFFFEKNYKAGGWEKVARFETLPDEQGNVYVDIREILTKEMDAVRNEPSIENITAPAIADNLRRYYFRYAQQEGSPAMPDAWQTSNILNALDGGVTQRTWAGQNWLDARMQTNSLLTVRPLDYRNIYMLQPDFLSWYNHFGTPVLAKLRIIETAADGTVGTARDVYELNGVSIGAGQTVTFPVSPLLLGIAATTRRYTVQVIPLQPDDMSELPQEQVVHYFQECLYQRDMRFILWRNSFGVAESLRCTGVHTYAQEIDRQKAQRPLPANYTADTQERVQWDAEQTRIRTFRTGYMRKQDKYALQDMLLINDIYEVQPDGSLCALDIISDNFRIYQTDDFLYSLEFDAVPRLRTLNHFDDTANESALASQYNVLNLGGPWVTNQGTPGGDWQNAEGLDWYTSENT